MPNITASRALPIGEISRATGVNIETIRYYERIGVMPKPVRTEGGHRAYDENQLKLLAFIRRSRDLGFSLGEIRALLDLVDTGTYTCSEVHDMTTEHLVNVKQKIADLRRMEQVLKQMAAECSRGDVPDCPIVDALFDAPAKNRRHVFDRRQQRLRAEKAHPNLHDVRRIGSGHRVLAV